MSNKRGILTVISGFSGAGKGTLIAALLRKYPYSLSVSATTRKPREGERHGVNYFFVSKEEFDTMIQENQLIEYASYVDNYYGTPKSYVDNQLTKGNHVILEIETKGAMQVKELFPDAILVFVTPSSVEEIKNRLLKRRTETMETMEKRLNEAKEESRYLKEYDYVVLNDIVENAMEQIHRIIQSEACRIRRSTDFIESIKKELDAI